MTRQNSAAPACELNAFSPEERKQHINEALALRELVQGYEYSEPGLRIYFKSDAEATRILEWARKDRVCCPWIDGVAVEREDDRVVLALTLTRRAAEFWIELFLNLKVDSGFDPEKIGKLKARSIWTAAGAGLGLACLLPLGGGVLVARGVLPAAWNPGEATYLIAGGALFALYFIHRWWRRRSAGCGPACS